MAKDQSDVFICQLGKRGYWAYPSPFVAHGGGTEIQFRNLTDDSIVIDFQGAPVHKQTLTLEPRAADYVIVDGAASAGIYAYEAEVKRTPKRSSVGKVVHRRAKPRRPGAIFVKGGSPPQIIIDT
jgi:hypothetical protein